MEGASPERRQEDAGESTGPLGGVRHPTVAAVQLDARTMNAIIVGVVAHLKDGVSGLGQPTTGAEPAAPGSARPGGAGAGGGVEGASGSTSGDGGSEGRTKEGSGSGESTREAGRPRGMSINRYGILGWSQCQRARVKDSEHVHVWVLHVWVGNR